MPARTRRPAPRRPLGASGRQVRTIAGIEVEITALVDSGPGPQVLAVSFPLPDLPDTWVIVSIARLDGSAWMVGWDGWQYDEFPTLEAAVKTMCSRTARKAVAERTRAAQEITDLTWKLRCLRASFPPAPPGAHEQDPP